MKTRSPMYLAKMNDKVIAKVAKQAEEIGCASWLVVELILEKNLNIDSKEIDVKEFTGRNRTNAREGKQYKKKVTF